MSEPLDLLVVGGGTAGVGVALRCAGKGWRVAVADRLPYGGTCALRGCDPKKMLVSAVEARERAYRLQGNGLSGVPSIVWADLMTFKRTFTDTMPDRITRHLELAGVRVLHGEARFLSPHRIRVGEEEFEARHVHIAVGARPAPLGIQGEEHLATSTDFLELSELPARLAFVGGGYISFEFANIARWAGAERVVILHRGSRPLKNFDPDLVQLLLEHLGIEVVLNAPVRAIVRKDHGYRIEYGEGEQLETDLVVHGAGRVPDLEALDLDRAGVEVGPRGIAVTESLRSRSQPHVFAAGDCADTSAPKLTPVSSFQAHVVAKNLLAGRDVLRAEYPPVPSAVFTVPPLGRVGLLEHEARELGHDVDVRFRRTEGWYSSLRVGAPCSAYKLVVERSSGRILGAHFLGPGAEEQLNLIGLAMARGVTARELKSQIFLYPSYGSDLPSMV